MTDIEKLIVGNLINNEEYTRKVLPYLDSKYFHSKSAKQIKNAIIDYYLKYKKHPESNLLRVNCLDSNSLSEDDVLEINQLFDENISINNVDALVDETEKFIKDRALYLGIVESIEIYDKKNKKLNVSAIPDILTKALQVGFNDSEGHDYKRDWEKRWEYYTHKAQKIPFPLDIFNQATRGGAERKTLNATLMATGTGKTAFMCAMATSYLKQGLNVAYFTMEMAEEKIAQRIDANLLDIELNDFEEISKERFKQLYDKKIVPITGKLKVKEFPTAQATVLEIRAYLDQVKQKDNFIPDVIIVDYLTIMNSARYRTASVNSYTLYKTVAEELRGLAIETNTCMWTGLQFNRSGFKDSDSSMTDIAESFGVPMTLDYLFIGSQTDELKSLNQLLIKQEKSRYDDVNRMSRFVIGFDKVHMRFYDLDDKAQDIIYSADLEEKSESDKKFKFSF